MYWGTVNCLSATGFKTITSAIASWASIWLYYSVYVTLIFFAKNYYPQSKITCTFWNFTIAFLFIEVSILHKPVHIHFHNSCISLFLILFMLIVKSRTCIFLQSSVKSYLKIISLIFSSSINLTTLTFNRSKNLFFFSLHFK